MEEYVENGAQLGWLLDPSTRRVYVYRPGAEAEVLEDPEAVSGEPLLRGFALDVRALWEWFLVRRSTLNLNHEIFPHPKLNDLGRRWRPARDSASKTAGAVATGRALARAPGDTSGGGCMGA